MGTVPVTGSASLAESLMAHSFRLASPFFSRDGPPLPPVLDLNSEIYIILLDFIAISFQI